MARGSAHGGDRAAAEAHGCSSELGISVKRGGMRCQDEEATVVEEGVGIGWLGWQGENVELLPWVCGWMGD